MCKNGMKAQQSKITVKNVIKECKHEIVFAIIFTIGILILVIVSQYKELKIESSLSTYVETRISLVTSIMAVFIGIYTTILTVISTSKISISELLLKSKMDKQILAVVILGMLEDFTLIILGFIPTMHWLFLAIYVSLLFIAMTSFLKFVIIVYRVFKINIEGMVEEIDRESEEQIDLKVKIDEILQRVKRE